MGVARKGLVWKIMQSWWILLTFSLMFNWVAFFYIASRAKNKRWALWGLIYSIPFILLFSEMLQEDTLPYDLMMTSLFLGCIFSIFHGFKVRKEFLLRLEARELASRGEEAILKDKIESEYGVKLSAEGSKPLRRSEPLSAEQRGALQADDLPVAQDVYKQRADEALMQLETPNEESTEVINPEPMALEVVDLNTATESDLAGLPGVGAILAKKAIQHRQTNDGFRSVDEFFELLGLKPHVMDRVRPLITVQSLSEEPPKLKGRVVDF